jgi:hypothetical protein
MANLAGLIAHHLAGYGIEVVLVGGLFPNTPAGPLPRWKNYKNLSGNELHKHLCSTASQASAKQ